MALTKEFIDSVNSGKKTRVRIMLKNIMIVDPSLKSFNEMIKYAENNFNSLYDEHDGELFNDESYYLDDEHMNNQMVHVINNFSKERIELLKKIVKKKYYYTVQEDTDSFTNNNSSIIYLFLKLVTSIKFSGVLVVIFGISVLIYGIVISSTVSFIIGIVDLIIGICIITISKNKEV